MPPTYRADQVGSFLRPQELKDARAAHEQGTLSIEDLREVEDRHIRRVLDMQQQVGIEAATRNEPGRTNLRCAKVLDPARLSGCFSPGSAGESHYQG